MKFAFICLSLWLSACSSLPQMQATDGQAPSVLRYRITDMHGADSMVIGEYQGQGRWRWWQSSILGAPLARQNYQDGKWHNDGFAPVNAQARQLFTALMVRKNPGAFPEVRTDTIYPHTRAFYYRHALWLKEDCRASDDCDLQTGQYRWRVRRIAP